MTAMNLPLDHFPIFEANQVLMSRHLNDVFDYLDQQTRLSRSHLIGIGIVCGLEITLDTTTTAGAVAIGLSKGCGVTSEGYLVVEPQDVKLVSYRSYTLPTGVEYPPFVDPATKAAFALWELFPAGEPKTTLLGSEAGFLDDTAVLLFLELNEQNLRNCSPDNCDDKGSEVTATVRRLLIKRADLDKIIAAAHGLGQGLSSSDLDAALTERLNLPDIRMRRFDVPNSNPVTSNDVYAAFLNIFRPGRAAQAMKDALSAAHKACLPLLEAAYRDDPFGTFADAVGFLDKVPTDTTQVKFLQYYADLFDDLVRAYDEFRWQAAELICACCPPDGLFPLHLMLGLVHPETANQPGRYRQGFLGSPAVSRCADETKAVVQLFTRLVELTTRFTNAPTLPTANPKATVDPQIRVTPSRLGDWPLATKAIPYYYQQTGTPPLYRLWSVEKTRRNRADRNLGYRADEYNPPAPAFVTDPLRYDLEPYDFLRVEGHLGKAYGRVLGTLLTLRTQYRLPIDIIALRTGPYDATQPVDPANEPARFQDLEALYDAQREDLLSALAEGTRQLYDMPAANLEMAGGKPKHPLLLRYAPAYLYPANSVGAWYEKYLALFQARPYIDVDQTKVDAQAVLIVYCVLFNGTTGLSDANYAHAVAIYYFSKLAEILPASLDALAFADFRNKYEDLIGLLRYFRSDTMSKTPADLRAFIPQSDLINLCEEILFGGKLGSITAVHEEYDRRIGDLRKRQFLATFLSQHPGIQHKAGVPPGGTFIVVYHGELKPAPTVSDGRLKTGVLSEAFVMDQVATRTDTLAGALSSEADFAATARAADKATMVALASTIGTGEHGNPTLISAINRIGSNKFLSEHPDVRLVIDSLTGKAPLFLADPPLASLDDPSSRIIATAVGELEDGTVIADFFLPYRVSCDCPGVQYVLPKPNPTFTTEVACTNPNGVAAVTVVAQAGVAPYEVSVDDADYRALDGALGLTVGVHSLKVRDAEGTESVKRSVEIATAIVVSAPSFNCVAGNYTASGTITGGTPPYTVNGNRIADDAFTTDAVQSGKEVVVNVVDAKGCTASARFTHVCPELCTLPCAGIALRRGFRFWIPDAHPNNPYSSFKLTGLIFSVESVQGTAIDLSPKIRPKLVASTGELSFPTFKDLANRWVKMINEAIASEPALNEAGKAQWLTLGYDPAAAGQLGMLGTLWIEYFECLKFDIRIQSTIVRLDRSQNLDVAYSPAGTVVQVGDFRANIPAFDGDRTDKCSATPTREPLCRAAPTFDLKVTSAADGRTVRLKAEPTPATPGLSYLWEVQDGSPAMGNGPDFTTVVPSAGRWMVTVTAFTGEGSGEGTRTGCRVTKIVPVDVR
jgi:hypothetical protein